MHVLSIIVFSSVKETRGKIETRGGGIICTCSLSTVQIINGEVKYITLRYMYTQVMYLS